MSKYPVPFDTLVLASIADSCAFLAWSKTEAAQSGEGRPDSVVAMLSGTDKQSDQDIQSFGTPQEFERARAEILGE